MKMKRFIAGLLSLIMVISMTGMVDVNAAETTESTLLAENLTDGTYTDDSADPNEDYVYTVVGSDGSVAEISSESHVATAYKKVTWDQGTFEANADTLIKSDKQYLIVGARPGHHLNKAIKGEVACPYVRVVPSNDVIVSADLSACEWTITEVEGGYTIATAATDSPMYLTIARTGTVTGNLSDPPVTVATTAPEKALSIFTVNGTNTSDNPDTGYANTVYIGSDGTWFNANGADYVGTYTGLDWGSCFYLYQKGFTVAADAISTATADVEYFGNYTAASWDTYEKALESAEVVYDTSGEAEAAFTNLSSAVSGLVKQEWADKIEQLYVKIAPDFTGSAPITDGIYVIAGARSGYNANCVVINDGTFSYAEEDITAASTKFTNVKEDYEWKFTDTSTSDSQVTCYVQPVNNSEQFMYIDSNNHWQGVKLGSVENKESIKIKAHNTIGSVCIGDGSGWLNHRADRVTNGLALGVGTYTDSATDEGSAFYLYQKQYTVLKDVITADVNESDYTTTSWTTYQAELAKINDTYTSLEEAVAAVAAVEAAVDKLVKIDESVLEACYVRLVPDADGDSNVLTKVEDGIYAIVGAHYDAQYGGRQSQNKVIKNDNTFTYGDLGPGPGTAGNGNVYETFSENELDECELYEWEFKKTSDTTNIYSVQSVSAGTYMSITSSGVSLQASAADIKLMVDERDDAKYNAYGGIIIGDSNNNVLNHQNNRAGVWSYQSTSSNDNNNGSVYYLFQKQYAVSADVIAKIEASVDTNIYSADELTAYNDALQAAETVKGTSSEAYEAYKALVDAVNNLSEVILPAETPSGSTEWSASTTVSGAQEATLELDADHTWKRTTTAITFDLTTATGFELLATCGSDTGMLMVMVKDGAGKTLRSYLVDTYYSEGTLTKVPVVREMSIPEGAVSLEVYGCLVQSVVDGRKETSTFSMRNANAVSTDDIVLGLLQEFGLDEELSVSDVEVSYMDENSVLNGGQVQGAATYAVSLADTGEASTTTNYVYVEGCRVYREGNGVAYTAVSDLVAESSAVFIQKAGEEFVLADYQKTGPQNEIYLESGEVIAIGLSGATTDAYYIRVKGTDGTEEYKELTPEDNTLTYTNGSDGTVALGVIRTISTGDTSGAASYVVMSSEQTETVLARLNAGDILEKLNPFVDVEKAAYFYKAVLWAVEQSITKGVDDTHFVPNAVCTRAEVVEFLWRAAGKPEVTDIENPFEDVKEDAYYYDAVLWAVEKGITAGVDKTHFAPEEECTRAQIVTFLWRAAGKQEATQKAAAFVDLQENAFYEKAVMWAVENDITAGVDATHFAPNSTCSRGETVTFLYRAMSENK